MQKGEKSKLKMLLMGIETRITQNINYFVSLNMIFRSGSKNFQANLCPKENTGVWELQFQGAVTEISVPQISDFFMQKAEQYDEAFFNYLERNRQWNITCTARGVQMKQLERKPEASAAPQNPLLDPNREYFIRADRAAPLLQEIGILTEGGKLKNDMIRKYNQIDHYVELVAPMFEKDRSEEILLLDCACGKSYLSFVMNYYLCEVLGRRCRVLGIDSNEHVITESRNMAKRLGYRNMEFQCADLRNYQPPKNVTAVISLHACDIATDLALATAIRAKAKYIACVPCCHKELLNQYTLPGLLPLMKHGVLKARFNDVVTDSMRALKLEAEGYRVSVVEYISPLDSPKNLLIRAERVGDGDANAQKAYHAVRQALGTTSELDRRCAALEDCFFTTEDDLQ